jgi:hypothetical protein
MNAGRRIGSVLRRCSFSFGADDLIDVAEGAQHQRLSVGLYDAHHRSLEGFGIGARVAQQTTIGVLVYLIAVDGMRIVGG